MRFGICGTVVCSMGAFYYSFFGTIYLNGVFIGEIFVIQYDTNRRHFMLSDKENSTKADHRTELNEEAVIRKLSFVSVFGNATLSGFKLFAGISGHSGAMISDAIHSFSDVLTTLIAWIGVKISKKDSDLDHPYGHERLECIASLVLGAVLLMTGVGIGKVGLENIILRNYETIAVPDMIALIAALVSIGVKEGMYWYTRYYAKRIHSSAFLADAWHHRSDAFSSVGSLIGIAGARLGYPVLDSVASVLICLFIVKVSFDIIKDAIVKLLDTSCGKDYEDNLRKFISDQKGVICVDLLRSRMFGNKVYIDLEIQVDGNRCLKDAHDIAENVHRSVEDQFPDVKHVMVHVNPASGQ